jgi:hypothetical protein
MSDLTQKRSPLSVPSAHDALQEEISYYDINKSCILLRHHPPGQGLPGVRVMLQRAASGRTLLPIILLVARDPVQTH